MIVHCQLQLVICQRHGVTNNFLINVGADNIWLDVSGSLAVLGIFSSSKVQQMTKGNRFARRDS